ncbi:L-fuculose-phosphate aldolase [Desulfobaculum xiamenense]|uniref:L-fuculose-phosphate aldolase n=1 Tax=Desulfobaculum xiamenense TaxID=995050 RepID=A0A846QPQ6_9BACT|nr:tRNA (N6-threonylcarbamoyladenosine(37)-N6)-methyltransferase TrmO [Desulfobaculum xiamenense]NJB68970.1 L-fuculose-phosphate aldolase [Desulfobaculum xiamenense]
MEARLDIIGTVHSPLTDLASCPKQYSEGAPEAVIEIHADYATALSALQPGNDLLVFTWLHKADRDTLMVHPRGNPDVPMKGVFATRSPDRPNPIGLHHVRILAIDGTRIRVDRLEALDQTPVVDLKPIATETPGRENWGAGISPAVGDEFRRICRAGWERGLLSGFNGNVSMRIGDTIIITRSGAAKGFLQPGDLTTVDLATGRTTGPGKASTETAVHLEIYRNQPEAHAIVHTHPAHLLAYAVRKGDSIIDLPLYEAAAYQKLLTRVPAIEPGTPALGEAVGKAAQTHKAVFMKNHGLVCWGPTLVAALALNEELDTIAKLKLLAE